jgi:hypothetical protein
MASPVSRTRGNAVGMWVEMKLATTVALASRVQIVDGVATKRIEAHEGRQYSKLVQSLRKLVRMGSRTVINNPSGHKARA